MMNKLLLGAIALNVVMYVFSGFLALAVEHTQGFHRDEVGIPRDFWRLQSGQ